MSVLKEYGDKHFNRKDGKAGRKGRSYQRYVTEDDIQVVEQVSAGVPIKKARDAIGKTGGLTQVQKELIADKQEAMRQQFLDDSALIYENLKSQSK